ncbi:MAG: polysaccharide biosynthesis protein, partial [Solirubrobacteraceae bacterium]|nr:polysaccharide biosynthesis protein [Solirubrobacteraceae bacterium]
MTGNRWARQRPWAVAVGDQALSSLGNLVLTVGVARAASREQLGGLAIALLLYALALGISRGLCTDPFTVLHGGREGAQEQTGRLLGAVLVVGAVLGGLVAVTSVLPVLPTTTLIAMAVVLPLLLLVDACRYVGFARGLPDAALLVDATWTVGAVVAVWALSVHGTDVAAPFVWWWGAAAVPALVAGVLRLDLRLSRGAGEWFRRSRHLGHPVTGQFLAETGTIQVANLLIAAIAGLDAAASVRVAVTVFAPVSVLLAGLSNLLLPRLSTRPITGGSSRRLVARATGLAVAASLGYLLLV